MSNLPLQEGKLTYERKTIIKLVISERGSVVTGGPAQGVRGTQQSLSKGNPLLSYCLGEIEGYYGGVWEGVT